MKYRDTIILATLVLAICHTSVQAITFRYPDVERNFIPGGDLAEFIPFNPPVTKIPVRADAPQIAEWTRSNQPGDTMALTGEALSSTVGDEEGMDTRFVFYGEAFEETPVEADGLILRLDGRQSAITLPTNLPPDELYLMWPVNNSTNAGSPVEINKAEAWWVGFDRVSPGETFYVYGRNLVLGDHDSYLHWSNNTTAAWGYLTNTVQNPFRNEYVVPSTFPSGDYTLHVNNRGYKYYGWSGSLTLTVEDKVQWTGGTKDMVADFNAIPDDGLDDQAAFDACESYVNSHPYTTVKIPAGTYHLSGLWQGKRNTRYIGAGTNETIITATSSRGDDAMLWVESDSEFHDLTISITDSVSRGKLISINRDENVTFRNIVFTEEETTASRPDVFMTLNGDSRNIHFENCTFIHHNSIGVESAHMVRFDSCRFLGIFDCNQMVSLLGAADGIDLNNCTVSDFDQSDSVEGYGWSKGRWIVDRNAKNVYVGDNETINFLPRDPEPFFTVDVINTLPYVRGSYEQILQCEDIPAQYANHDTPQVWVYYLEADGSTNHVQPKPYYNLDVVNNTVTIGRNIDTQLPTSGPGTPIQVGLCGYVDFNSGEQYLMEGAETDFCGIPSEVPSSTTLVFDKGAELLAAPRVYFVSVVGGTGIGQSRPVASIVPYQTTKALVTLAEPWRVVPDTTSKMNIGGISGPLAIYNNIWDGRPDKGRQTASAGVALWGTSGNIDIVGNTFSDLQDGLAINTYGVNDYDDSSNLVRMMSQSMFNNIRNNHFINNETDILRRDGNDPIRIDGVTYDSTPSDVDVTFLGNVFRNNTSLNASTAFSETALEADLVNQGQLSIWQDNSVTNAAEVWVDSANQINLVWVGNKLHSKGNTDWVKSSGNTYVFRENDWGNVTPPDVGGVLELPLRVVLLGWGETYEVPIWNSGTESMDWNVSENANLNLVKEDEKPIPAQDQKMLSISLLNTNSLAPQVITIEAGGQTKEITILHLPSSSKQNARGETIVPNSVLLALFEPSTRVKAKTVDLGTLSQPIEHIIQDLGELDPEGEIQIDRSGVEERNEYWIILEVYDDASSTWAHGYKIRLS